MSRNEGGKSINYNRYRNDTADRTGKQEYHESYEFLKLYLTLKQHCFELHGSTCTQIVLFVCLFFYNKYS